MNISQVCRRCGSDDLVYDEQTGETICLGCGLVVARDNRVNQRYIEKEETSSTDKTPSSRKMDRLMTIDKRIRVDEEDIYVLRLAVTEIKRLVQAMHLPEIIAQGAEKIYRRAQGHGLVLRGTIVGFAAASVYAACRMRGIPRTLREVSEVSAEDVKSIARMYRVIVTELGVSVELDTPLKHLSRIASDAGLSHRAETLASKILYATMDTGHHVGKSPEGLAASALYISCSIIGEACTQRELSDAAGVSQLTIRKRVKGIKEAVDVMSLDDSA
jgi:transcription initiation factor TFIIB